MSEYISIMEAFEQHAEAAKEYVENNFPVKKGTGTSSTIQGSGCTASGGYSHAEGYNTKASGYYGSHAEGNATKASGYSSHAEGGNYSNSSSGVDSGAPEAFGTCSHAEGAGTVAMGTMSHAEGYGSLKYNDDERIQSGLTVPEYHKSLPAKHKFSVAYGAFSHSQNVNCVAFGARSHAGGNKAIAEGQGSFAHGLGVQAEGDYSTVIGKYNSLASKSSDKNNYAFIIGNGSEQSSGITKDNAMAVHWNGTIHAKTTSVSGFDYAEFFEWEDGNINDEDRIGYVVTLKGDKIAKANANDRVLGIISGTTAIVGDNPEFGWKNKYLTDEFGRTIYDLVEEFEEIENAETNEITKESMGIFPRPRINPAWNPEEQYIPREERKEWDKVGLLGKIHTRDDGTCQVGSCAKVGKDGILTYTEEDTNMYVMERTSDNIVLIMLK